MKNSTFTRSKRHLRATLLLFFSLLSFNGFAQLVPKSLTAANGQFIGFYQYTPTDYNPNLSPKYPLIIFLHGIGERGDGTTQLSSVLNNGTPQKIKDGHTMRFFWNGKWETFLVLIPQLSGSYGWWQDFYTTEMIKYAKANLNVDTNRITLAGLSLGGGGVWSYSGASVANAKTLNAIGVCCGTCQSMNWCNITAANLPTWAFHASDDGTVGAGCTTGAISYLNSCNPAVKPYMTIWPDGQHWIWGRVYDTEYNWQNPNIYEWFLGQDKSKAVNIRPIARGGADKIITTGAGTVTLDASASTDADGTIQRYIWTKLSGPYYGTITTPVSTNGVTTVTGLTSAGTYQYLVKVVDDRTDWTFDTVTVTVNTGSAGNQAPTAKAGSDIVINLPTVSATLNGTASFDPEGTIASYSWTKISGPATYNILTPGLVSSTVNTLALGTYLFRLEVKDAAGLSSADTVKLTVNAANQYPLPNAGNDIVITLPINYTTLDGSASVDPDGNISKYEWSRLTGPTQFTIANLNSAKTDLTNLMQGTYTFKLTVWDNIWVPATDTVKVTVLASSSNQPPVANAGTDINITLPTDFATLNGTGSTDPDGNNTITTYAWTRIGGPTQFTMSNAAAASNNLTNLAAGTYSFRLVVTDAGSLTSSDTVIVKVNAAAVNKAPVADAGTDIVITLPTNFTSLNGSASADPDGSISGYAWTYKSGPSQYTLGTASSVNPALSNLVAGTYVFLLTVTDNEGATGTDSVKVTVNAAPVVNLAPVANAGNDIVLTLPKNDTTLNGSASTDADGSIATWLWTKISGPAQYTLSATNIANPALSNLAQGSYSFELLVTDNDGATARDTVLVGVNQAPPAQNQLPVALAGNDIIITLPTNSTPIDGSASYDPDGSALSAYEWTRLTGPTQFTLGNANAAATTLSNLVQGTYTFKLRVWDNLWSPKDDTIKITVNPEPNVAPIARAGADIAITLPTNSTGLNGTASSDANGDNTINSYAWTKIGGPAQFTLANANSASTGLSNLVQGTYLFELVVTDNGGLSSKDTVKVTVNPVPNRAPVANAGADINIPLPNNSTTLDGSGSTDPDGNNTIVTYLWNKLSGPGQYTIANTGAAASLVSNLVEGTYQFVLKVTDNGGLSSADTVTITVSPIPNRAPVANAGADISIALPKDSVLLDGAGSSDPEGNSTIVSYSWARVSGPTQFTLANSTAVSTMLRNLAQGTYVFELTVTDQGGLSSTDKVTIIVSPTPNRAPVSNAGTDISMTLPVNSTSLDGSASSDPDGNSTITYSWAKISGPGQFTIANNTTATTALTNLVDGVYTFELTVTDNYNITSKDTVKVTVILPPNVAPIAYAGADQHVAIDSIVTLDASGSYDPDGVIISYAWAKVDGPASLTMQNAASNKPVVRDLEPGTYSFELTVTDNRGGKAKDTVLVIVAAKVNIKPVANAGVDTTIAVPATTAVLNGLLSTDADGSIVSYSWKQLSGPSGATISGSTSGVAALSDLKPGKYEFELTVTDNSGESSTDVVEVSVVNNLKYTDGLMLYPNPVSTSDGRITIRCMTDTLGVATITIMDHFGRPIQIVKRLKTDAFQEFTMNIAHLRNGVYYMEVQIERKKRMVAKFIKL